MSNKHLLIHKAFHTSQHLSTTNQQFCHKVVSLKLQGQDTKTASKVTS